MAKHILKKAKKTGNWLLDNKASENLYGGIIQPIWNIYPGLKSTIMKSNSDEPFQPSLKFLPNKHPNSSQENSLSSLGHPYHNEINSFKLPKDFQDILPPFFLQSPKMPEYFPYQWISTKQEWKDFLKHLSQLRIVYLDIEGHSFRSYRGITCLIQINDGTTVYFVDSLNLFDDMHLLNSITTNPEIIKLVFGGDNDVINMEKDFSVYFVGLIDIQLIYKCLHPNSNPIAYNSLVEELFGIYIGKELRCSDFRKRPLHEKQCKYAFLDVYFLPYLFKHLLVNVTNFELYEIQLKCSDLCKKRYKKPNIKSVCTSRNELIDYVRHLVARLLDCNPELILPKSVFSKLISCNPKTELMVRKNVQFLDKAWDNVKHMSMLLLSVSSAVEEWATVVDTANRELGLQCSSFSQPFCFKCNSLGHIKKECKISKEEAKIIKKQIIADDPMIRIRETRRRNANKKASVQGRRKWNRKETLRKRRKMLEKKTSN